MRVDQVITPDQSHTSQPLVLASLVGANLVPLVGVLAFNWSVQGLLVVYWLESAVIGLLNVPKIQFAHGAETAETHEKAKSIKTNGSTVTLPDAPEQIPETPVRRAENWGVAVFFLKNYGGFWLGHGLFVALLPAFGGGSGYLTAAELPTLLLGVGAAAGSHYISYRRNYLADGEWRTVSPGERLNAPYSRVIVMHLTIVGGAFLIAYLGLTAGALVVMIAVKTLLDLNRHLKEHREEQSHEQRDRSE